MPAHRPLIAIAAALLTGSAAHAAPRLDPVFTDHAVLQRDRPIRMSGEALPRERLRLAFAGSAHELRADPQGRWRVELPALKAGGPYRLEVRSASGVAAAEDILIGDVWLCSGQSNMEWPVRQSLNGEGEVQGMKDDQVRILTVAQTTALVPQEKFEQPPSWALLTPATAADFSAACAFMARNLRSTSKGVPIGAIDASWGGTRIRPWMDEGAARATGGTEAAELLALYRRDPAAGARRFAEQWGAWWRERTKDALGEEPWNASDRLEWRPLPSIQPWEQWGDAAFTTFDGYVWARRRVTLTDQEAAKGATLSLGVIDDLDQTWVNGVGVGNMFSWSVGRDYPIAPGILRAGVNEIIVNLGDSWGPGGFQGPAERLKLTFADGSTEPLGEGWEYSVVPATIGSPPRAPWDTHAGVGTIYNGMIAPLGPLGLKGVAWYQGEADAGIPGYDARLAAWAASWRRQFRDPQLPFLVVALAGFGQPVSAPVESGWAALIDEQRRGVAADPHMALVVATDLGERNDIHPPNKKEVGRRLALAARAAAYGDREAALSPTPLTATRTKDGVRVTFSKPLNVIGGPHPIGFELCGEAQGSCRWAEARIEGSTVLLPSDGKAVARVRYGWSDFPILTLYAEDLPAPAFELPVRDR